MYAIIDGNQRVSKVFEWDGAPVSAPEGSYFVQTSMYKEGDFYGCAGLPAFTQLGARDDSNQTTL